jgi:hypothetical protein
MSEVTKVFRPTGQWGLKQKDRSMAVLVGMGRCREMGIVVFQYVLLFRQSMRPIPARITRNSNSLKVLCGLAHEGYLPASPTNLLWQ